MPSFPLLICEVGKLVAPEVAFPKTVERLDGTGFGMGWALQWLAHRRVLAECKLLSLPLAPTRHLFAGLGYDGLS